MIAAFLGEWGAFFFCVWVRKNHRFFWKQEQIVPAGKEGRERIAADMNVRGLARKGGDLQVMF